jgi:acyl carrier protein
MDQAVADGVEEIVSSVLRSRGKRPRGALAELRLLRDGHLDSMDIVTLVTLCERRFEVRFEAEDLDEDVLDSVAEICHRVEQRRRPR